MGVIGLIERKRAGEVAETALHVGDHHVLDFELGVGVGGVDFPGGDGAGGGGSSGGGCGAHRWWCSFHRLGCRKKIFVATSIFVDAVPRETPAPDLFNSDG